MHLASNRPGCCNGRIDDPSVESGEVSLGLVLSTMLAPPLGKRGLEAFANLSGPGASSARTVEFSQMTATSAPFSASARAIAAPIPREPAVAGARFQFSKVPYS